jgi:hypothetical protein
MSSIEVRRFHRRDRDQLTGLVNAHAAAVVPGMGVSVATVLGQLEREPGEFIVDPWVSERVTLVAEQRGRIAAAALLLRYASDERVSPSYRGVGDIRGPSSDDGPTSATSTWRSRIAAPESRPGCSRRRASGYGWHRSSASLITHGWRTRTKRARVAKNTVRSSRVSGSSNSLASSGNGPGSRPPALIFSWL